MQKRMRNNGTYSTIALGLSPEYQHLLIAEAGRPEREHSPMRCPGGKRTKFLCR